MKNVKFKAVLFVTACSFSYAAATQFVVSDPGLETEAAIIDSELAEIAAATGTTATELGEITTIFNAPTASATGITSVMDGGGSKEALSDIAQLDLELDGTVTASPKALALVGKEDKNILADEVSGSLLGDPFHKQFLRDKFIANSFQGDASDKSSVFAARYAAIDTMVGRLMTANIKDATVLGGIVGVANMQQAVLNGQTLAQILAATGELVKHDEKHQAQYSEDHSAASKLFVAGFSAGAMGAAAAFAG